MLPQQSTAAAGSRLPVQRPDCTDRPTAEILIFLPHAPVSTSIALRSASTPNGDFVSTPLRHRMASNFVIHVQQSQLGTCYHSSQRRPRHPGCPCNDRIPPTDRWLKFQSFFVTLLFPLPMHCGRLRRQTETPPALHFVIVCASNFCHPRPAVTTRNMLPQQSTAAAASRLPVQRPDCTDRPTAEILIFLPHAPVSTSIALRSASTPKADFDSTPLRHRMRQ